MLVALWIFQAESTVLSEFVSNLFRSHLTIWWAIKTFPSVRQGESECKHILSPPAPLFSSGAPSLTSWVFCPSRSPPHQHPTPWRFSMSLSTAHPWSPLSLMFQPRMGLSITTQHVTLGHFMSHHIFQSTYVYGAFTSCQTLFQAVGTQKREHWSKIPAQDLPSTGENKQDRCIFKTVINTKKEKKKNRERR